MRLEGLHRASITESPLCGISVATQLPHNPRLKLLRFSERRLSWRISVSVDRKSAARQAGTKRNASRREFSITRYEGGRWRLAADAGSYGESNLKHCNQKESIGRPTNVTKAERRKEFIGGYGTAVGLGRETFHRCPRAASAASAASFKPTTQELRFTEAICGAASRVPPMAEYFF
jgi:hypothetical protein